MPHTTLPTTGGRYTPDAWRRAGPQGPVTEPPNHLRRWRRTDEDILLAMFAAGNQVDVIASRFGRTTGAINARLAQLLGIRYPDTPNQYRRRGDPIRRRGERTSMPRQSTLDPSYWEYYIPAQHIPAQQIPPASPEHMALNPSPEVSPETLPIGRWVTRPATPAAPVQETADWWNFPAPEEEDPPPEPELPPHLDVQVDLENLSAQILAARPSTRQGRTAIAQHAALNRVAHNFANLLEATPAGENFNRTKWLQQCGVTEGENHADQPAAETALQ